MHDAVAVQPLQDAHDNVAASPVTVRVVHGAPGQGTSPGAWMHAAKPAGGGALQTSSAQAEVLSQSTTGFEETFDASFATVAVQATCAGGAVAAKCEDRFAPPMPPPMAVQAPPDAFNVSPCDPQEASLL